MKIVEQRMSRMTRSLGGLAGDPEAGAFIGFHTEPDSSSDEAPDPPVLLQGYYLTHSMLLSVSLTDSMLLLAMFIPALLLIYKQ